PIQQRLQRLCRPGWGRSGLRWRRPAAPLEYACPAILRASPGEFPLMSAPPADAAEVQAVRDLAAAYQTLTTQIGKVIVGQKQVIEQLLMALFSRGHCLLVGVPG